MKITNAALAAIAFLALSTGAALASHTDETVSAKKDCCADCCKQMHKDMHKDMHGPAAPPSK